jgi:mono/diheme cytochrome c family protein
MRILALLLSIFLFWGTAGAKDQKSAPPLPGGEKIYSENCSDCHRANGAGLPNTFPALHGNSFVQGDPDRLISLVLNGRKGELGRMPAWKNKLDDRQVAAVVSYIRQAWSNQAPAVTPEMVGSQRKKGYL